MTFLTLKPRQAVEEEIENWDDDDLDLGGEGDFTFRSTSIATSASTTQSNARDSISSRLSIRSEFDTYQGDEEKQFHLPENDQRSTNDAIAQAARAGVPIPQNVPPSALMGGTIKRLGGRKIQKIIKSDDWDEDLELPDGSTGLQIRNMEGSDFPDALRQVSGPGSVQPSPMKGLQPAPTFDLTKTLRPKAASRTLDLDRFRDDEDDDDFFGDGGATIKVAKSRPSRPITNILPPTPQKRDTTAEDDFDADFELPTGSEPLRLSARKDIPKTPVSASDEFDDWAEGSLGTRFGGTKRDGRSNRSSSASALSPSVASSRTVESEDEGLDGLVLPVGPLNFDEILRRRQDGHSPEHLIQPPPTLRQQRSDISSTQDHEFMTGLEFEGDVFDSTKLTLNRNIKVKNSRQTSPQRPKTAVSLVFTNKPSPPSNSRIPRPPGGHSSSLAPVSESGGPIMQKSRRSQSRLGGHSTQSSLSSIVTPLTPSSSQPMQPSTPRRRDLNQKSSTSALRSEATTTNAQLLKIKRSMPTMRAHQSPAKPIISMSSRYDRPPSRTDTGRPMSMSRPKTPVERDRSGAETSMSQARKNQTPFLPAGASHSQSQHVTAKTSRNFRRHDSESSTASNEFRPSSRAVSRAALRSPSPQRSRARGAEALAREAASKRQITKPVRRRHFGDGFELDGFDDLPTSQNVESKYTKQPIGRGVPKALLRNKIYQNTLPERTATPAPLTPLSPARQDSLPRFARDTNASRMAREQVLSQRTPSGLPLGTLTNQRITQLSTRPTITNVSQPPTHRLRSKKPAQLKPHLIKPLGEVSQTPKSIKGMVYNPLNFRWEGNENDLSPFDAPNISPTNTPNQPHSLPHLFREKENSTPRPALITNINASQGVQVVGGMVFDPVKMCWLKMPASGGQRRDSSRPRTAGSAASVGTMDAFNALEEEDEEDVFKDVPDLEDKAPASKDGLDIPGGRKSNESGGAGLKDEWLVGEEFDVGPEFIRRQREEEDRWRRKCEKWLGPQRAGLESADDQAWRWGIRDVVREL